MKKFLCMLLTLAMLASMTMFAVSVSAAEVGKVEAGYTPEGTAITDAAGFAAMTADGKYYLANDITIDATWNGGAALSATYAENTAFTGTLDGNGHKITTTAPVFANLAGTVKNLTVEGDVAAPVVSDTTLYNAALAIYASGTVVVDNVVSKANVLTSEITGGLIAYSKEITTNITVRNSVNEGAVSGISKVGGIIGFADVGEYKNTTHTATVTIENCVNRGNVSAAGVAEYSYVGGIAGRMGKDYGNADNIKMYIKNCENHGKVFSDATELTKFDSYTAGMVGFMSGYLEITDCVNNGVVENNKTSASNAAGILSGISGRDKYSGFLIDKCINNGAVKGSQKAVGIAGYFTATHRSGYSYVISNCVNNGELRGTSPVGMSETMYVCGIAGQFYGGTNSPNAIVNCVNNGDLYIDTTNTEKSSLIAGIYAYTNSSTVETTNCISAGNMFITGSVTRATTLCYSATKAAFAETTGNYVVGVEGTPNILSTGIIDNLITDPDTDHLKVVTADEMNSGAVVYAINEAAGANIYYQDLKTGKITTIAAEDGSNLVIKDGDTYKNLEPVTGPQAIKNADDFAAMIPTGEYYLDADITLSASYEGVFTGILDGKNHTITTTAPLFNTLAGSVKNLTVNGEIAATAGDSANVAITTSGDVTFENIVTNANILGAERAGSLIADSEVSGTTVTIKNCTNNAYIIASQHAGGFVGRLEGGNFTFNVDNCVNNGEIRSSALYAAGITPIAGTDKLAAATAQAVDINISNCTNTGDIFGYEKNSAGIIGYAIGVVTIDSCVNTGDITNTTQYASGILGSSSYEEKKGSAIITNCENHGTITGSERAAGIASYFGRQTAITGHPHTMTNCANYGEIRIDNISTTAVSYASGIAAYAFGGTLNGMSNCLNAGNIVVNMTNATKNVYVGGHIGYVNSAVYTFKNNVNIGNITVTGGDPYRIASTIVNVSTTAPSKTENNYTVNNNVALAFSASADFTYTDAMVKEVSAAQVASGELVYMLNAAAGETVFYQDLANNGLPTLKANDAHIVNKTGDVYHNGAAPAPEVTTPEVTTPEVTTPENTEPDNPPNPPTSDNGMIVMVVAFVGVALVGIALAVVQIKRKEN